MTVQISHNSLTVKYQHAKTLGQSNAKRGTEDQKNQLHSVWWGRGTGCEDIHLKSSSVFGQPQVSPKPKTWLGPAKILTQSWASLVFLVHAATSPSVPCGTHKGWPEMVLFLSGCHHLGGSPQNWNLPRKLSEKREFRETCHIMKKWWGREGHTFKSLKSYVIQGWLVLS